MLDRGGAVESITWMKREIEEAAYRETKRIEAEEQIVVGVNKFAVDEEEPTEVLKLDPEIGRRQVAKLEQIKADARRRRGEGSARGRPRRGEGDGQPARPDEGSLPPHATLGEVCGVLREEWGIYRPESTL